MSERQRGLGRGLSALLEEAQAEQPVAPAVAPSAGGVRHVPIELIRPNPNQPRKAFDQDELQSLADSIRSRGVIQPIVVRPRKDRDNEFEIIAGERRWRAAQLASLHQVPVIVRNLGDNEVYELAVIENVQRADLNPIEEAVAYQELTQRGNRNQSEVASLVGKSRVHVSNTMRLLELPTRVRDYIVDGRLTAGHARAIATAPDVEALADRIVAEGMTVRQAEALAQAAPKGETSTKRRAERELYSADTAALQADLADALGIEVLLKDRGGRGELVLKYATLEQLDDLCRRLMKAEGLGGI